MDEGIREQDLPGIGRRYDLDADGAQLSVVIHHSGRRDLYVKEESGRRPPVVVSLTDDQSRRLGAVLAGAYFRPAVAEQFEAVVGGLVIDWVTLRPDSPGAGRSIAALEVRRRTRMTIVAILRGEEALVVPDPLEVLQPGDRLVVLGRPEHLAQFIEHVIG